MAGQVLAVASGKGGVGKTTTVVNLGVALRRADHAVVLVDGDLGMANLGTLLGISSEATLHDVLAGEASIDEAVVEEAPGFGVLVGSEALTSYPDADPKELRAILEPLAERYEYVLVDTGAGMSHEDVLPLGLADQVVLVTTPDPAAIGDTKKTAELADLAEGDVAGCVVTQADASTDGHHVAAQLGVDLLGVVPFDVAVRESTASGSPLEAHDPTSPAAAAYRALAATLAGEEPVEPLAPAGTPVDSDGADRTTTEEVVEAALDAHADADDPAVNVEPAAEETDAVDAGEVGDVEADESTDDADAVDAGQSTDGADVEADESTDGVDVEADASTDADAVAAETDAVDAEPADASAEGNGEAAAEPTRDADADDAADGAASEADEATEVGDADDAAADEATEADEEAPADAESEDADAEVGDADAESGDAESEDADEGEKEAEDDDLEAYLEELDEPEPAPSGGLFARLGRLFR